MGRLVRKSRRDHRRSERNRHGSALRLAREGAVVVITIFNSQGGEQTVSEIQAAGRHRIQHADVASEADIRAAVDRAVREYGQLNIITFNNAGLVGAVGPMRRSAPRIGTGLSPSCARCHILLGIKHSVEPMRKAGGGSVVSQPLRWPRFFHRPTARRMRQPRAASSA